MSKEAANYWLAIKQGYEKQKSNINNIIEELETLRTNLENVPQFLRDSETNFKNGGYYDGETLDRGVLKYCYDALEDYQDGLLLIISKSRIIINELDENIKSANNKYLYELNK